MPEWINRMFAKLTAWMLTPFHASSPWPALLGASAALGILALVVFKLCSRQAAIRRAKGVMTARLLEIALFKDDFLNIFSAFGRTMVGTFVYLRESLIPLFVLIIPVSLLVLHLAGRFEFRPLRVGEHTLVTAVVDPSVDLTEISPSLKTSPGIIVETEPFLSEASREIVWRVGVDDLNTGGWVEVEVGDTAYLKTVAAGSGMQSVNPLRARDGLGKRFLNLDEARLPAEGPLVSLTVEYPDRVLKLGSWHVNWLLTLVVVSIGIALALKRPLRVEF